jgi:hypothetical protein
MLWLWSVMLWSDRSDAWSESELLAPQSLRALASLVAECTESPSSVQEAEAQRCNKGRARGLSRALDAGPERDSVATTTTIEGMRNPLMFRLSELKGSAAILTRIERDTLDGAHIRLLS